MIYFLANLLKSISVLTLSRNFTGLSCVPQSNFCAEIHIFLLSFFFLEHALSGTKPALQQKKSPISHLDQPREFEEIPWEVSGLLQQFLPEFLRQLKLRFLHKNSAVISPEILKKILLWWLRFPKRIFLKNLLSICSVIPAGNPSGNFAVITPEMLQGLTREIYAGNIWEISERILEELIAGRSSCENLWRNFCWNSYRNPWRNLWRSFWRNDRKHSYKNFEEFPKKL